MGQARRGERRPGKSDEIDAIAVARAALQEGVDTLPIAFLDEPAFEIRLLCDHRADLVAERTRHQNRLCWAPAALAPGRARRRPGGRTAHARARPRMLAGPDRRSPGGDDANRTGSRGPRR